MKIYIHTDLEGASGVNTINQIFPVGSPENLKACLDLTYDTDAAVKGAFDAGADEVYVLDCHGPGNNIDKNIHRILYHKLNRSYNILHHSTHI